MSKVSDLATFQLHTQEISQTIQISDIQVCSDISTGPELDSRMDGPHRKTARRDRASQLEEFTNWLSTRTRSGHHHPSAYVSEPLQISDNNASFYRADCLSQPQSQLLYQSPHFETRNYVQAVEVDQSSQPVIGVDGSDVGKPLSPATTNPQIISAIRKLKADGRILGDSEQFDDLPNPNLVVPAFRWPQVSTNLLGNPAMLNLETNIKKSLQTYRTQIVVTSSCRQAGASTVALSLARQLAENNSTVLLIDADLDNPSLAHQLGLTTQLSWTAAINDGRPTNQLIVKQKNSGLSLLPLIKPQAGYDTNMYDILATISNPLAWIYDYVVIDVGPADQYLAYSSRAKIRAASTLLVSDCSRQTDNQPHSQHAKLRLFGADNLLIVQNFSHIVSASKVG